MLAHVDVDGRHVTDRRLQPGQPLSRPSSTEQSISQVNDLAVRIDIAGRPDYAQPVLTFVGAWAGAMLGGLIAVVYDTSAKTAAFEGGRRHLTFNQGLTWMAIGAGVGGLLGLVAWAARESFPHDPKP